MFLNILHAKEIEPPVSDLTSADLGIEMIGGITVKTSSDFFEQASNPKSVLLIKIDGSLKSFKVGESFQTSYRGKPYVLTIFHIYNKYHMKVSYEENDAKKYFEVVRVGFSNKKAQIPKSINIPKKPEPQVPSSYSEDGFERNFDGTSGDVKMTSAYKKTIESNLSSILMQAAATPVIKHQAIIGFMLEDIDEGSMFEKAGFVNGDIVTSINGRPLNNAASAVKTLNGLRDSSDIAFEFMRGDQTYTVSVTVD